VHFELRVVTLSKGQTTNVTGEQRMKIEMTNQRHSTSVMGLLLLVAAVLACSKTGGSDETQQANKLVTEGNAAVQEAKKHVTEAGEKLDKMLKTPVAKLKEARASAAEAITAYDNAKEKCKEASKKYEEASKLKIKDKFREYLTLKVKEFDKRAELVETAKGTPQALIDAKTRASFVSVANANNDRVARQTKEADDLAGQADKLQKDNPDSFK
jgi:PAB1-binding protein PBP1